MNKGLTADWRRKLQELARGNEEYAKFHKRIVNTKKMVLGVRVPDLRKTAKSLAGEMKTAADVQEFLTDINDQILEEVLSAGFVINYAKLNADDKIKLTRNYLTKVDSWAEVDLFSEHHKKADLDKYWDCAMASLQDKNEFVVRFGIMVCLANFLTAEKLASVFAALRQLKSDKYYVKMAMAWLYAEAAVKFYEVTMAEIKRAEIDEWTRRKAWQKMLESRRISDSHKAEIRAARKRND
ncbi:MAG: DNA alkylation repair protein [Candidatus Nomurabacteria bacterium]|jgi:3-methyladenine DNA glycosylase AlkD|nr:DNA alkylation repair protein [Candidatus Nomurabacteria bacterium]